MPYAYRSVLLVVAGLGLSAIAAGAAAPPSPTPQGAASPAPKAAAKEGTSALVVDDAGAETLLGLPVRTSKGEDLGHVVDVVVDRGGALLAAIIDFGGFLGVGSRKIAVDWRILHFPGTGALNQLIADLPRDRLRNAPAYKPGEPIVIMGAAPQPTPTSTPSSAAGKP